MTIEQIELRKILSQMLADEGINRETLKDLVKEVLEEKFEKAVKQVIAGTNIEEHAINCIRGTIANDIRSEIRDTVRSAFSKVHVSIDLTNLDKKDDKDEADKT